MPCDSSDPRIDPEFHPSGLTRSMYTIAKHSLRLNTVGGTLGSRNAGRPRQITKTNDMGTFSEFSASSVVHKTREKCRNELVAIDIR